MSPDNIPANIPPKTTTPLKLRCYGYKTRQGAWVASCLDLSLMVERPSMEESIKALHEQIVLYVRSVLDTEDKDSISYLIPRIAPWQDQVFYHLIAMICRFRSICRNFAFKEEIPLPQAA
jgi:hypothetical protein